MARALDPTIARVLKEYDETPKDALWDCHGTWVVYHKAIERMAARAGIAFDQPVVIEANAANKVAVICVTGTMGDRYEWSFGEACPANNKNAYPFAMAEKRAKDRVVLKLLGLHGLAYSEDESDDFKEPAGNPANRGAGGGSSPAAPASANRTSGGETLTGRETGAVKQGPAPVSSNREDPADTYVKTAIAAMNTARSAEDLKAWWADQANAREDFGIAKGGKRYALLWDAFLAKGTALKSQPDPDAWQSEEEAA